MRLEKIVLRNYLSYEQAEINLQDVSLCSIVGSNGAGKSTISDAVIWCLYGVGRMANQELVRSGSEKCEVELDFSIDTDRYHVERSYDGKVQVRAHKNSVGIAMGNAAVNQALAQAIGVPRELLIASLVITQGQLSSFIEAVPSQRRDLIISMLGMERYVRAWEVARQALQTLNTEVSSHDGTVMTMRAQVDRLPAVEDIDRNIMVYRIATEESAKHVQELTQRREEILARDQSLRAEVGRVSEEVAQLRIEAERTVRTADQEINKVEVSLRTADQQISTIDGLRTSLATIERSITEGQQVVGRLKELRQTMTRCEGEISRRRSRLAVVSAEADTCPVCGSHVSPDMWGEIMATMQGEIDAFAKELDQTSRDVRHTTIPGDPAKLSDEAVYTRDRIAKAEALYQSRGILVEHLDRLKHQKTEQLSAMRAKLDHAETHARDLSSRLSTELETISGEAASARALNLERSGQLSEWVSRKRTREQLEDALADAQSHLELAREHLPETRFIAEALSPAGVPLLVVDYYLPVVAQRARELLATMSDGNMDLALEVVDTGGRKGVELRAGAGGHLRPIKMLSGGEQTRTSLALRIALSQLMTEMAQSRFDILIVDEPPFLDNAGVQQFVHAIVQLKAQYGQIFVISHVDGLKHAFPRTLVVEKRDGCSTVEIV